MRPVDTAKMLAFIGARDGWVPNDSHVWAWHRYTLEDVSYMDVMDRILDHRPGHAISLCCVLGNCDPASPHRIPAEEPDTPYRWLRGQEDARVHVFGKPPFEEQDFALMVHAVGMHALEPLLAIRSGVR